VRVRVAIVRTADQPTDAAMEFERSAASVMSGLSTIFGDGLVERELSIRVCFFAGRL
jgi:hypothetical protein